VKEGVATIQAISHTLFGLFQTVKEAMVSDYVGMKMEAMVV
jgi:hypothetical protein